MRPTRRLSVAMAPALFALASCTFPDVQISDDAALPGDANDFDATVDGDAAPDARPDVRDSSAVDAVDATTDAPIDTAPPIDAGCIKTCDCDNDGDRAKGGACGGLDCDDFDAEANTKVTTFKTFKARGTSLGDWNCDGKVVKAKTDGVNCGSLLIGACGTEGFIGPTGCGDTATYVVCQPNVTFCKDGPTHSDIQGCL